MSPDHGPYRDPPKATRKRTIHDWIWTGLFVAVAAGVVYVAGWVLVP